MKREVRRPIALVWGARDPAGLYLPQAVERWRSHWPAFQWLPACSDVPAPPPVFPGRADQALAAAFPDLAGHVLHCCGSPAMVDAVRAAALAAGLAAADFHADAFVPGPATGSLPAAAAPPVPG